MSTYKKLAVGDMLEKLCLIMAIAAIVIHYIGDKNTLIKKSGFLLMCLLPTIAVYTAVTTSGGTMIKMFLFALAFKDVEKKTYGNITINQQQRRSFLWLFLRAWD